MTTETPIITEGDVIAFLRKHVDSDESISVSVFPGGTTKYSAYRNVCAEYAMADSLAELAVKRAQFTPEAVRARKITEARALIERLEKEATGL